jgi:hypothetical protein
MTELPHEYARRAAAYRLLSALGHLKDQHHAANKDYDAALDAVLTHPNARDVVAYLAGLAFERFRDAANGDWDAATATVDENLKLAEDLDEL